MIEPPASPGLPNVQMRADTHVFNTDVSDAEQLTRAEIEGRRQVRAIMDVIRKYGPSHTSIALADLAATIGARETRRIVARYRLTGDDVLFGRRLGDAIGNGSYPVDIHHADGPGITIRNLDGTEMIIPERGMPAQTGRWRDPLPEDPTFYQIPFRCLVPERVPNLVLAGRMLDTAPDPLRCGKIRKENQDGQERVYHDGDRGGSFHAGLRTSLCRRGGKGQRAQGLR